MQATAGGREFRDGSWNGLVSRVVAAYKLKTTPGQRVDAARDLMSGYSTTLAGIVITPKK